jgi:hypothetical protein
MPPLDPSYAADKVIEAILTNQEILMLPRVFYLLNFMKGFFFLFLFYCSSI